MPTLDQILRIYQDLADWHEQHGPPHVRDRFLILAADAALGAGREDEADRLRHRLLQVNPHHMLRPFSSFAEALQSPDVRNYVHDLRKSYPPDVAMEMHEEIREKNVEAPGRPVAPIPPTMPVVDLDLPPPAREPKSPDPAVVYWDTPKKKPPTSKPAAVPSKPAPRPTADRKPAPPDPPQTAPGKLGRMATARRQAPPLMSTPVAPPPAHQPAEPEEEESSGGGWVAAVLFGVLLIAGVALAVYTLLRPFLPI